MSYGGIEYYTVERGDTWESIAEKFGLDVYILKCVNKGRSCIYAGKRIKLGTSYDIRRCQKQRQLEQEQMEASKNAIESLKEA